MGFDDPVAFNTLVDAGTNHNNVYQGLVGNTAAPSAGGTGLLTGFTTFEAGWEMGEGLAKGDVGLVALGAAAGALDVASAMSDPIAYVGAQIVSWMLEHVEPARKALESVTGNPATVKAYAASWVNIQQHMTTIRDDLQTALDTGITSWEGEAATAYRVKAAELIAQADAAAGAAYGTSVATLKMAEIVTGVRTAIRDLLSALAGAMISWTAELLISVGTATPLVIAQAISKISNVVAKAASLMVRLDKAIGDLGTWAVVFKDIIDGFYRAETAGAAQH